MNNTDKYRAQARYCMANADRTEDLEDKVSWLYMAQNWLGLIPERERNLTDPFDVAASYLGTGQTPSTSIH